MSKETTPGQDHVLKNDKRQYIGPIPAKLTLLSDLKGFKFGDKVRFLGNVIGYDKKSAILSLKHNFPLGSSETALVNITLVLPTIKSHETQVGEWVNVIGYIETESSHCAGHLKHSRGNVAVQALLLWSSGPLQLDEYEKSLKAQKCASG